MRRIEFLKLKLVCLSLIAVLYVNLVYSQQSKIITVDFLNPEDISKLGNDTIRNNTKRYYLFENANPRLYDIVFDDTPKNYHTDIPEIFKNIGGLNLSADKEESSDAVPSDSLSEFIKGRKPEKLFTLTKDEYPLIDSLNIFLRQFNETNEQVNKHVSFNNFMAQVLLKSPEPFAEIKKQRDNRFKEIGITENAGESTAQFALQKSSTKNITDAIKYYDKILEVKKTLNDSLIENRIEKQSLERCIKKAIKGKTKNEEKQLAKVVIKVEKWEGWLKSNKNNLEQAQKFYKAVKELKQKNFTNKYKNVFQQINESNYQIMSSAILAKNADEIEVDIKFSVKDSTFKVPSIMSRSGGEKITLTVFKGIKIDFSPGVFFNFGDKIINQSYHLKDIEGKDSLTSIVENKDGNKILPSFGALMHIYCRSRFAVNPGLAFGLSTNGSTKFNYHLGGSVIFGKAKRAILSSGVTLRQAELLYNKYVVGQEVLKSDIGDNIPLKDYWRRGWFISFTYNIK